MNGVKLLKIGISGVRGVVGQTLTPGLATSFGSAFGTYLSARRVLLGMDTRKSSEMLKEAVESGLISTGCDVIDLATCPTPILQYMVRKSNAAGAVSISAGHNDASWNAINFINSDGMYLNPHQGEEVLDIYHSGEFDKKPWDTLGEVRIADDPLDPYLDALSAFLDVKLIGSAAFKVIIDPCNGAGSGMIERFCERIGVQVIPINNEPNGIFPHDPEPRPRNARQVASIIKPVSGDIGFVLNSDVSRVSIISETGETVTEEYTFPLVADYVLSRTPGTMISNYSTTRTVDDVAQRHSSRLVKTLIGHSHSVHAMTNEGAVIAGEGSGGIAVAAFQPAFDGFATMGLILEAMARSGKTSSALVESLPRYHIVKYKIPCPTHKVYSVVEAVEKDYSGENIYTFDGVRVDWDDGWVHVRASGTEPVIRIIAEGKTRELALERAGDARALVERAI